MRANWIGLAGLVALAALVPRTASGQEVSAERRFHAEPGQPGRYALSLPWAGGIEDVANSDLEDPCDLSSAVSDGWLNADDLICTIWGAGVLEDRHGLIMVSDRDAGCRELARTAFRPAEGEAPVFIGPAFDFRREAGFLVTIVALDGQPLPDDRVVFTGPCEPTLPPQDFDGACSPQVLNLPYDTLYRTANELLCGIYEVDWTDGDANGVPDTCPAGLFGASQGTSVTVMVHLNPWDLVPRPGLEARSGWVGRTLFAVAGNITAIGTNFRLVEGDGPWYGFGATRGAVWDPPVEGCD